MAHLVEDYYDMPADELPSANFAGRPTSDIDMLGGYWTLATYSSSSSEDDDDNDSGNRASPQRRILSRPSRPAPKLQRRAGEKGPSRRTSTFPPTDDISQGSGVTGPGWRVLRRREQETASGSLEARTSPLFGPTSSRAGGARLGYFDTVKRKRKTRTQSCDETGSSTATSRAIPGNTSSRTRATSGPPGGGEAISPCAKQSRTSFAHPTRVRRMGQSTQLAALDTGVTADESKSRRLASSPSSVLSTPRELYGTGDGRAEGETAGRAWQRAANIVGSPLSSSARSNTHCRNEQAGRIDVADPRNIDWPGAMMPAPKSARVRRDSVATGLEASTFDAKLGSKERRYDTEQVGPGEDDDIVTFFEEFGVVEEATEATLDRFWLRHSCTADDDRSAVSSVRISGVGEAKATAETPQVDQPSQSSFSSSSASSCSAPQSRPQKRKRSRLRDLWLSPGLPGAAFRKIPAS